MCVFAYRLREGHLLFSPRELSSLQATYCLPHQRLVLITCFMRILALGSPAGIEGPAPFGSTSHRYVSEVRLCVCF